MMQVAKHARERAIERGVAVEHISAALIGRKIPAKGSFRLRHRRVDGDELVIGISNRCIVTVYWEGDDQRALSTRQRNEWAKFARNNSR